MKALIFFLALSSAHAVECHGPGGLVLTIDPQEESFSFHQENGESGEGQIAEQGMNWAGPYYRLDLSASAGRLLDFEGDHAIFYPGHFHSTAQLEDADNMVQLTDCH